MKILDLNEISRIKFPETSYQKIEKRLSGRCPVGPSLSDSYEFTL